MSKESWLMKIAAKRLSKYRNNAWCVIDILYYLTKALGFASFGKKYNPESKQYDYITQAFSIANFFQVLSK